MGDAGDGEAPFMGAIRVRTDVLSGVGGQTHLSSCNDDMALDIGIIGIVWQFGIIGLLLGFYQYVLVWRHHRRIKSYRKSSFYQAVLWFLIFFVVRGIPTGGSWFDPGIAIASTFVAIHYFFYYSELFPERNYTRPL